jgi:hypothetical protein
MMRRTVLVLSLLVESAVCLRAQCVPQITEVSSKDHQPVPSGIRIPHGTFIQASYALNENDRLLLYSQPSPIGTHIVGIAILSKNKAPRLVSLSSLPALRRSNKDGQPDSFYAEKIVRGCSNGAPIYFVESHWDGDIISPELVMILVPSENGYSVSTMPLISGGVLEISRSDARSLTVWSSLHEGECNACETAYEVSTFRLRGTQPIRLSRHRTRKLYDSGDPKFDSEIDFVP